MCREESFLKERLVGDSFKCFAQVKEYGTQLTASIQGRITIMGEGEQGSGFLLSKTTLEAGGKANV